MNILFIVPYVPNLIRVRSYNLIKELSARGHRVTVLTLWSGESERLDVEHLCEIAVEVMATPLPKILSISNCLKAIPSRMPLQAVYCWHPRMAKQLVELLKPSNSSPGFDVIHVEHLRGARYGVHIRRQPKSLVGDVPVLWDSVDCISSLFRKAAQQSERRASRWIARIEQGRTERYERWLVEQFDRVLVTSTEDKQALMNLTNDKSAPISILPNGVDLAYFSVDGNRPRAPATLVISGKMSYHANVSMVLYFVNEILPRIWYQRSDVELWIVGKDPPREILTLAKHPKITVTGTVPDIRPFLMQATMAIVPLTYGAGVQNKVLEAMACGTPVVSTPTAISALKVVPEEEVLIGASPEVFAHAVLLLIENQEQQRKLGEAGRRYVERNHRWPQIAEKLESIYDEIIRSRR
jgi:sugar transferase (PEP-CTERM/EpsH1 system associated)